MATENLYKPEEWCSVCVNLPLRSLTWGQEGQIFEHVIQYGEFDDDYNEKDVYDPCALQHYVRRLDRIWSGKEDFPTKQDNSGTILDYTCASRKKSASAVSRFGVIVLTDPTTQIHNLWTSTRDSRAPVHVDPLNPLVIARMKAWIHACDAHEGCHVEGDPLLPTRVLDVEAESSSYIVKLVETTSGQRGSYIALSHCWGSYNSFITTRDNLAAMKGGFFPENAPSTFKDAITMTRKLGIRYLWIDSLCIIQGDANDWETESSRMSNIYRDATLTLSASYATADSQGFLKHRPSTHSTLKVSSLTDQSAELYLRPEPPSGHYGRRNVTTPDPLDTRGWCLQETYLSRRQIKFLEDRILWSCRDVERDETEKDRGGWIMAGTGAISQIMNLFRGATPRRHRTLNLLTPYQGFYRMVKEFTRRNLTFASDVLPAVSGLAAAVEEHDKGRYCAGLWWEDIAFGLCWKRSSTLTKPPDYHAPSWSWASTIGPVEFIDENEVFYRQTVVAKFGSVVFHDFWVQPHGVNSYGQLDNACLRFDAPMVAVSILSGTYSVEGIEAEERADMSFDLDTEEEGDELKVVLLLRRLTEHDNNEKLSIFGLIVRSQKDPSRDYGPFLADKSTVYERVGFITVFTTVDRETNFWQQPVESLLLV